MLCDNCPTAWHLKCLGLKTVPSSNNWSCPHHKCCVCERKNSAAGLLFRCECCADAYCEDCVPVNRVVIGVSERMQALGYQLTESSCYIQCSDECVKHSLGVIDGLTRPASGDTTDSNDSDESESGNVGEEDKKDADILGSDCETESDYDEDKEKEGEEKDKHVNAGSNGSKKEKEKLSSFQKERRKMVAKVEERISNVKLGDVKARLLKDEVLSSTARFVNLSEVPCFRVRWNAAHSSIRSSIVEIIKQIKQSIAEHTPRWCAREDGSSEPAPTGVSSGEQEDDGASVASVEQMSGDAEDEGSNDEMVFSFPGLVRDKLGGIRSKASSWLKPILPQEDELLPKELVYSVFLDAVKAITGLYRNDIFTIAKVLGFVLILKPFSITDSSGAIINELEPQFRYVSRLIL